MISNFEVNIRLFVRESLTEEEEGIINLAIDNFFFITITKLLIHIIYNNMTNNVKLTDWAEYFDAVPSSTLVNKGCMENLFKTFNSSISSDEAIAQVEKHTKTVFLARLSLRSGLNVFHHFIQV